jgi:hypothetical protein
LLTGFDSLTVPALDQSAARKDFRSTGPSRRLARPSPVKKSKQSARTLSASEISEVRELLDQLGVTPARRLARLQVVDQIHQCVHREVAQFEVSFLNRFQQYKSWRETPGRLPDRAENERREESARPARRVDQPRRRAD